MEWDFPGKNLLPVSLHALLQPSQFLVIAAERHIEHVFIGDEAECIDRIGLLLRRKGQKYKQEHQACYRFLYYIHCIIHVFDGLLICMWYCRDI